MKYLHKIFLFSVGVIALAYDEVEKTVQHALDAIDEERHKVGKAIKRQQA